MSAALELSALRLDYGPGRTRALDDVTFSVERGESLVLIGRSGSGKTSVLRALLGLERPASGTIRIDGALASEGARIMVPPEERKLAVVFQELALWPHMTVERNVSFALEAQSVPRQQWEERSRRVLREMDLAGKEGRMPGELSGGERQRVALARALVVKPVAVLLDEPLASLDPILRSELRALLRTTFSERQTTALYVTHDRDEARELGHRVAVIDAGRIVQIAPWAALCEAPANEVVRRLVGA